MTDKMRGRSRKKYKAKQKEISWEKGDIQPLHHLIHSRSSLNYHRPLKHQAGSLGYFPPPPHDGGKAHLGPTVGYRSNSC